MNVYEKLIDFASDCSCDFHPPCDDIENERVDISLVANAIEISYIWECGDGCCSERIWTRLYKDQIEQTDRFSLEEKDYIYSFYF